MAVLAEPTAIITAAMCPAERTTAAGSHPRRRSTSVHITGVHIAAPVRRRRPVEDPDRAEPRIPAVSGSGGPERTVDAWPLRVTDPVTVGGHRLVFRLGAGGMADVFYAVAAAGGPVAVKVLRAADGSREACEREYRLVSAVDADCTAPALGYGVSAAGAYLVIAYLPGYRSGVTLVGRSTPARRLWAFGSALARVLASIHSRGVVHCDVKPSNLLVRGHDVRVIDFGIARYAGERGGADGTVQCSRGWAAPEQLHVGPATPAVDVFAWGCVLAYLAGGVHPFASHSDQEWARRLQAAEPVLAGLPSGLDEVIRWTLARDPRDRPSAHDLATICRARCDGRPRPVPHSGP